MPEDLGDFFNSVCYACNTRAVRAVGCLPIAHPASSLGPHTPEVAAAKSDTEDAVEVTIDDGTTGKEVAVCEFDSQSYTRTEI